MVRTASVLLAALVAVSVAQANPGGLDSYKSCRECHSDIFELWKGSLHAKSFNNPTFRAAYIVMMSDRDRKEREQCLRCHAPMAYNAGDMDPNSELAAEGVTCSFCHSISASRGGNIDTCYVLDNSGAVYGPYEPNQETSHDVVFSPLHLSAKLCAGCHEYKNKHGTEVLGTFSEWQASPYPQDDVQCQNCHMPIMYDRAVTDLYKVDEYYVTAHEFRGGHSNINLANAARVETKAQRQGIMLHVTVRVTNAESGHKLPTGVPIRKVVLTVSVRTAETQVGQARRVYRKVLVDKYGTILEDAPSMFLDATAVYSDNRIEPGETRVEEFSFEVPRWITEYRVETVLTYEYSRPILADELVQQEMARNTIKSRLIE